VLATAPGEGFAVTTLEKICLIALAAFWLASAAWPERDEPVSAAGGSSVAPQQRPAIPPLP